MMPRMIHASILTQKQDESSNPNSELGPEFESSFGLHPYQVPYVSRYIEVKEDPMP